MTNKDEFGIRYIDLLIECALKLEKVMSDPSLGMLTPTKVFKTDLTWMLKDINDSVV